MTEDKHGHLPAEEAIRRGEATVKQFGEELFEQGVLALYFTFYCEKCGEKSHFEEPNVLYEFGMCRACGHHNRITHAGYMLSIGVNAKATDMMREACEILDLENKKRDEHN